MNKLKLLNSEQKGYLLVFVSILAMANVYIFSKAALNEINIIQFGVYWFGFALVYNLIFLSQTGGYKNFKFVKKSDYWKLALIGTLEITGTLSFFMSIKTMNNPALVSFLGNAAPVFVSILGISFLKERFNKIEIIGIIITIVGAIIISYNPGFEIPKDFRKALYFILFSNIIYAIATIFSKKNIKLLPPSILSINRVVFILATAIIAAIVTKQNLVISNTALLNLALGSILGPFLAALSGYTALKYIEASKASVMGSAKSLLVLFTSYIYFGNLPYIYQIYGGIATIAGVLLISLGKKINTSLIKNKEV